MIFRLIPLVLVTAFAAGDAAFAQNRTIFDAARNRMVDEEIVGAGVKNERVIAAMRATPRHEFVPSNQREYAYYDMALPIGSAQTISPPFIVAYMTEQLDPQPHQKVLEIGTGSGYQAAVLSPLVKEVYSIEIVEALGKRAAQTLSRLKRYDNVHTKVGDGYQGWPEHAPFDSIIVTCSPEDVPQALVDQLAEGGRMIIPLGERYQQTLYLFKKEKGKLVSEALRPTLFVPMTGAAEDTRKVKPDPLNPVLLNGGFEEIEEGAPTAWHYQRQLETAKDPTSPEGTQFVVFANTIPGRGSQALQGMGLDGRAIAQIELSCQAKGEGLARGATLFDAPALVITFYDERRAMMGTRVVGPWLGTFDWERKSDVINVPFKAREAIVRIGLLGGTGRLSLDDVKLTVTKRAKER